MIEIDPKTVYKLAKSSAFPTGHTIEIIITTNSSKWISNLSNKNNATSISVLYNNCGSAKVDVLQIVGCSTLIGRPKNVDGADWPESKKEAELRLLE